MRRLITILAIILMGMTALSASQRWENVDASVGVFTHVPSTAGDDAVEVAVSDGYVYVAIPSESSVKVFTILGQLVCQETLQAGTHRMQLSTKGMYIIKVGDVTKRVAI